MSRLMFVVLAVFVVAASSMPTLKVEETSTNTDVEHRIWKRFINPDLTFGGLSDTGITKMRTKRNAEECEKLQLCKLHARSGRNFFAAYELYFVNKENARLWDHRARSVAECEQRFGGCDR